RHAAAIVGNAQQLDAAAGDLDADGPGAGVERVLEQLLGDGGGALDHLASGDARGDLRRQDADRHGGRPHGWHASPSAGPGAAIVARLFGAAAALWRDWDAALRATGALPPLGSRWRCARAGGGGSDQYIARRQCSLPLAKFG